MTTTNNNDASKTIISVRNLKKKFSHKGMQDLEVLKDISFDLKEGEVLGIIGPSGSGKSTMLRCISQLTDITDGTIEICGKCLAKNGVYSDKKVLSEILLSTGFVFQNFNLFPHMSVMENLVHPQMKVLKKNKEQALKTAEFYLELMALSEKANSYPCELSGGQQQRVSIARSLCMNPKVLFFDEPTSALDPELTGEVLNIIKLLAERKITMIIVTHEMAFARDTSDHIIFMDKGYIIEQGPSKEVINNPKEQRTKDFLSRFQDR